jgi:hypothetical protein
MKNLLRLIVVALACQASVAQAFEGGRWLTFYYCENQFDITACTKCKRAKDLGMYIRFFVDKQKQSVLRQIKTWDGVEPPHTINPCVVADDQNWSCRDMFGNSQGMANGLFSGSYPNNFFCAK